MLADAEVVTVMAEALAAIGLPEFTIRISHRRVLECIGRAAGVPPELASRLYRAVDKLDKVGPDGVVREMAANGIAEPVARRVIDLTTRTGPPRR
jgi:histidyl-tRNA synthetase